VRPSTDYSKVTSQASGRVGRLVVVADSLPRHWMPEVESIVSYVTIEAFSVWYGLNRSVFLACATGAKHPTVGRIATPHGRLDAQGALDRAVWFSNSSKTGQSKQWTYRDEPSWGDQAQVARVFRKLAPSNHSDFLAAWGVQSRFMSDLPTFRNYYAHKSESSARKAKALAASYGVPGTPSPTEILLFRRPSASEPVLAAWLLDMQNVVSFY